MSAYDMVQSEPSARLLHLEPRPIKHDSVRNRGELLKTTAVAAGSVGPACFDETSIIELLLDRLADRVAARVLARLGSERDQEDEWLDSRQAAEYLGLHRDTLRRLAAARAIPSEQDGRGCRLFFRRAALDQWRRSGGRSRHLAAIADAA